MRHGSCPIKQRLTKETLCEQHWYNTSLTWLVFCLLPLSWIFRMIVGVRRFLYRINFKKSIRFPVPVIVVGNITVGGTGKTPFVIGLAKWLREQGYTPGIVSRGVGGKQFAAPYWVSAHSSVQEVGDEAVLLAKRTQCSVVICTNRVAAVHELLTKIKCDVVISDDGLQHYRLARDGEIAIIDGMRQFGNGQLLPAGPLREPISRLSSVDLVVQNGCCVGMKSFDNAAHHAVISVPETKYLNIASANIMELKGDRLVCVSDESKTTPIVSFHTKRVHAVAAIGNPPRFFTMLRQKGFDVIEHAFPDHYLYTSADLDFYDDFPIIMTEKDAVKCRDFSIKNGWYIPVDVELPETAINQIRGIITKFQTDIPKANHF